MYEIQNTTTHNLPPEQFYEVVKKRLKHGTLYENSITLMSLDFDNFNYVNDLFGYEIGDLTLQKVNKHFESVLHGDDVFCRIHADLFLICLNTNSDLLASQKFIHLTDLKSTLEGVLPPHYTLVVSGGILVVEDFTASLTVLLDNANCARKKSKGNAVSTFHIFDKTMNEEVQWKKQVTFMMEAALNNREFEMYLQPKLLIDSEEIIGAEALVRWNSPIYGMVYPDRFISIMEQNGFVRNLDFFMLNEACCFIKRAQENGLPALPISVNFSKAHLQTDALVEKIFNVVNRSHVPTHMIEIEFTESLFSGNIDTLIEIVADLKLLGFRVSIDDFGNAYSSLSYLKDLPVDIVKIDKGFLNTTTNSDRGKVIVAKVVELIKSLRMLCVMEGVETKGQKQFLQKLSCDIGQGYYYAKPMPTADYMHFIQKGHILEDLQVYLDKSKENGEGKSYLHTIPQEFQMDNWELYTLGKNIDMGLMKGYLDGEATVQYVNDRALEYLGFTRQEFREIFQNSIVAFTHPDDAHIVQENAEQLISTGKPLEFRTRAIRKDKKVIILQGRSSCVIDKQGRPVGIYAFQDVTDELEKTTRLQQDLENKVKELEAKVVSEEKAKEELRISEERYRLVIEQSDDILFEWDFITDNIYFSNKYEQLFGQPPLTESIYNNQEIRKRVHPDDLGAFEHWVTNTFGKSGASIGRFRLYDAMGNYLWVSCRSISINDSQGVPIKTVGVFSNVDAQIQQMEDLKQKAQLDPLTSLLNKIEYRNRIDQCLKKSQLKSGVFFMIDVDNFKEINDSLGHQMGDTVLLDIASCIHNVFRETDLIGRIGGDEFAIFLPEVNEQIIHSKGESLTQLLRLSYYGSVRKYEISASIGIACYPEHGDNFDALYRYADIALYDAKHKGKDQYVIFGNEIISHLIDNRTPVEYSANFLTTYFQNDFTFHIFEMLYETKDISATMQKILELMGKKYEVDRVYIFEEHANSITNTFEWCAPGISIEIANLQNLPKKSLSSYFSLYSPEGVYCCENVECTDPLVYEICVAQGIKSLLHCALYNDGVRIGFIGFDSCTRYRKWTGEEIAMLGYISRILSVFIIKNTTTNRLKTSYSNYAAMIENLNGFVYVIDAKTFEVLFVNRALREIGLFAGLSCYQMAFGISQQCENCPIRQMNDQVQYATSEIFSQVLQSWVSSAASKMKWEGDQDAILVCCTNISKYKS